MGSAPPGAGGAGTFPAPDSIVRDGAEEGGFVSWAPAAVARSRSARTPLRPHDRALAPIERPSSSLHPPERTRCLIVPAISGLVTWLWANSPSRRALQVSHGVPGPAPACGRVGDPSPLEVDAGHSFNLKVECVSMD